MHHIEDNVLIFNMLERYGQLPPSYNKDAVYSFIKDDSFLMVIYTCSGNEKGFRLFRIDHFSTNGRELNDILLWLQDEMEKPACRADKNKQKAFENAVQEVSRVIASASSAGMFYDAH
jgi:hypothetical protein